MTSTAPARSHQSASDLRDQDPAEVDNGSALETTPRPSAMRLDRYEREMLLFYVRWAPYGGPPEAEVFPEFGLSLAQMLDRVRQIIATWADYALSVEDHGLVHRARCVALRRGGRGSMMRAPSGVAVTRDDLVPASIRQLAIDWAT